jgi:hypothetical protein
MILGTHFAAEARNNKNGWRIDKLGRRQRVGFWQLLSAEFANLPSANLSKGGGQNGI